MMQYDLQALCPCLQKPASYYVCVCVCVFVLFMLKIEENNDFDNG